MRSNLKKFIDPLYQLFEQHLMTRSYDDAAQFTKQLARDYVAYLDSTPAHVPLHLRGAVLEDLELETHEMLVKKMYGIASAADYQNFGRVMTRPHENRSFQWVEPHYVPTDDQAKKTP